MFVESYTMLSSMSFFRNIEIDDQDMLQLIYLERFR